MKTERKIKAVIYARVSSKEQEDTGYSLEAQESLLKNYAEQHNFELVKVYRVTESASGKQLRKMFIAMIDYVVSEDVEVILCEKIDRLTRNLKDAATASDWVLGADGREIHFVKENFVVSKNTRAHENFVWDMKVAMARFYTNNLSEEVKKGQNEKIKQGWLPTTPPLGYKTIGEKGHKIHVIDEDVAPYIREMYQLYATGNYSTGALGKKMYELGFRSRGGGRVVKSKIHKLLCEVFYYGKFIWRDKEYQGKHEPIISRDLFDAVKAKMTRGNAPYYRSHLKELRGKVLCGNCQKTVTWELQKGHWYGACKQCKAQLGAEKQYVRYEYVEERLMSKIDRVAPSNERVLQVLQKALKESHKDEIALHEAQENSINASLERIRQRKSTMYIDRLDGRISIQDYDAKVCEFTQEEEILTDNLKKLRSDNSEYYKVGISIHELALRGSAIYRSPNATIEERRAMLAYAYEGISVLKGDVTPSMTKAFGFLEEWLPQINEITLEPTQNTAETYVSNGALRLEQNRFSMELSELRNDSRTSKESLSKPRPEGLTLTSRPLLPR